MEFALPLLEQVNGLEGPGPWQCQRKSVCFRYAITVNRSQPVGLLMPLSGTAPLSPGAPRSRARSCSPRPPSYTVQWKSGSEAYAASRQQTVTASRTTISGLTNGTTYTVRVQTRHAGGTSACRRRRWPRRPPPFRRCRPWRRGSSPCCSGAAGWRCSGVGRPSNDVTARVVPVTVPPLKWPSSSRRFWRRARRPGWTSWRICPRRSPGRSRAGWRSCRL